jgi:aldehyde dehydrogenase (NAD+)
MTVRNREEKLQGTRSAFTTRDSVYIDGTWRPSTGSGVIEVIDTATENAIGSVPEGSAQDVDLAVAAASNAFPGWWQTPQAERAATLNRLAEALTARKEEITEIITREVGHPYHLAEAGQTMTAIGDLTSTAEALSEVRWDEAMGSALVVKEPVGVVGAITPWNSPLHQVCCKVGPAMAAGCTVVLKASEVAPLTAFIFAEACAEVGVPAGVVNLVSGPGPTVGEAIARHPLVDMVSLTGSLRAGRRVMEVASGSVKRVALELGGKSPNILLPDADFERAVADGLQDCFRNAGQVCGALSRMIVPRAQLGHVEALAADAAKAFVPGDPFDESTTLGPVASAVQRERIRSYIRSGIAEGATLVTGGPEAPEGLERGFFVKPTVFSNVTTDMTIAREEIFGPVLSIIPYDTEEEAVAIANDTIYGLAGGVWSRDAAKADAVARVLRTGRVRVNGGPLNRMAPHGGYRQSGFGREWGRYGIEEFLEVKSILR